MRRGAGWLVLLLTLAGPPALAEVEADDLERAAAEVERARAAAGEAGAALAEARAAEGEQRARLERAAGELADAESRLRAARHLARQRVRWLYITAGDGPAGPIGVDGGGAAAVRQTYASAVGRADREVVNALATAQAERERERQRLIGEAGAMREIGERVAALAASAGPTLAAAEAEYARLETAWHAQEAERLRREQAVPTTTSVPSPGAEGGDPPTTPTRPPPTTTTTIAPAPAEGGSFSPLVERWRALVGGYFPAELVEPALAVIACESLGDPAVVNPISGTAGLFQHHPQYWPERAAAAGFPGAPAEDPEANIAAAAWLVFESVSAGLDPWFFWACRP